MSPYELSQRQEILMEKGAGILGDLIRYCKDHQIEDEAHPVNVMYKLTWKAKQSIIHAKTEAELDQIVGQFNMASDFANDIEVKKVS